MTSKTTRPARRTKKGARPKAAPRQATAGKSKPKPARAVAAVASPHAPLPEISGTVVAASVGQAGPMVHGAPVNSSAGAATGLGDLCAEASAFALAAAEAQWALGEALLDGRALGGALAVQAALARTGFEGISAQWAGLADLSLDLAQVFVAPLQAPITGSARLT